MPQCEVHAFIQDINRVFPQAGLNLGRLGSKFPGLSIQFRSKSNQLRPRFLGTLHNQEQYHRMQTNTPDHSFRVPGEDNSTTHVYPAVASTTLPADHPEVKQYDLQILQALDLAGNKKTGLSKRATTQAREQHHATVQFHCKDNLEMVERFLGFRAPKPKRVSLPASRGDGFQERPWHEELAELEAEAALRVPPPPINPSKPPTFAFDSEVVFVCIDVEAYEKDNSKITEIGVSTLDSKDLEGIPPGHAGREWCSMIRARHFRYRPFTPSPVSPLILIDFSGSVNTLI